jgi:hypothetical protein
MGVGALKVGVAGTAREIKSMMYLAPAKSAPRTDNDCKPIMMRFSLKPSSR